MKYGKILTTGANLVEDVRLFADCYDCMDTRERDIWGEDGVETIACHCYE